MPVFLVGGLAVQISRELGLSAAALGLAVAVYFGVTAASAVPVGRLVERFGSAVTARLGILLASAAMVAIAASAHSYPVLLGLLAVAAAANSLGQLSSNAMLGQAVPVRRQGLAFGVKQAAIPFATLLASVSVPTIALTAGWRWAFVAGAGIALVAVPVVPGDPATRPGRRRTGLGGLAGSLVLLGVGAALAAAAANSVSTFLVASAVDAGHSESVAGVILTVGSAVCVSGRVLLGLLTNRWRGTHLAIVGLILGASAGGIGLLGTDLPGATLLGVCIGYGVGWSFPGLLTYAVVRLHPQAPAAATSLTQTGIYAGSCIGPLVFGLLVTGEGYQVAWTAAAGSMALAAFSMVLGSLLTERTAALTQPPVPAPARTPAPAATRAPAPAPARAPARAAAAAAGAPLLATVGRSVSTVPFLPAQRSVSSFAPASGEKPPPAAHPDQVPLAGTGIDPAITGEPPEEQANGGRDHEVARRQPQ
jgi:MFS family permease